LKSYSDKILFEDWGFLFKIADWPYWA